MAYQNRWHLKLITVFVILSINGCAMSKPPYVSEMSVLSSTTFSSQYPPEVCVRLANAEESRIITDFPGKEDWERSAKLDSAGALVTAPCVLVFIWPVFLDPKTWQHWQDLKVNEAKVKEALEQFPDRLTKAIEQRLPAAPEGKSRELLEVIYFADVYTTGPAADTVCFVVHAQITLQSDGKTLYREIIRIDPRSFSNDIPRPDCTKSPEKILNCVDEILPAMIWRRVPGLPWKLNP
jgi:hypothetical protein